MRGKFKLMAQVEDVNGNGIDDVVVQFEDDDGVFSEGDTTATVTGQAALGNPPVATEIRGTDAVCIVP